MNKADEMFEKLGYKRTCSEDIILYSISYSEKESHNISFNLEYGTIKAYRIDESGEHPLGIINEHLPVINLKCKELGWIE